MSDIAPTPEPTPAPTPQPVSMTKTEGTWNPDYLSSLPDVLG